MTKWEYRVLDSKDIERNALKSRTSEAMESYLNELGEAGWEIVNIDFRELERRLSFVGVAKRVRGDRTIASTMRRVRSTPER
jgi:hypothetical protein